MKLILIDDDCLVVSALKMILENEPDFKVAATAHDGREALPLYREHSPDVLLMDIRMKEIFKKRIIGKRQRPFPPAEVQKGLLPFCSQPSVA